MTTDFDLDPASMRAGDPRSTTSRKALLTRLRESQYAEEKYLRALENGEPPPQRPSVSPRGEPPRDWDVIVIGGGATGLGVAVDAASRGFRTLLLEQRDFASGTSSKATKLVHGGVRYLAQRNFPLVKEALHERGLLLKNAPHLVQPLGFVVPAYRFLEKPLYQLGLKVYDFLAGPLTIARSRGLSRDKTLEAAPTLAGERLRGGVLYHDAQFDDARLAIALARTVFDHGGLALNYMRVTGFLKFQDPNFPLSTQRISGVETVDAETGETFRLTAHCVINAAGVWVDSVRELDDANAHPMVQPSQGTHLVLSREFLPGEAAILVPRTDDGRVLFVVPWLGHTLIGTTDTPRNGLSLKGPADPVPLDDEIDFILSAAARYLTRAPGRSDVLSAWSGLRPLVKSAVTTSTETKAKAKATSKLSREHTIAVSTAGLLTVTGGKWTTYRKMAEDVLDAAFVAHLLEVRPCQTEGLRLHGAPKPGATLGAAPARASARASGHVPAGRQASAGMAAAAASTTGTPVAGTWAANELGADGVAKGDRADAMDATAATTATATRDKADRADAPPAGDPAAAPAGGSHWVSGDLGGGTAASRASANQSATRENPDLAVYGTDAALVASLEGADEPIVPQFNLTIAQVRYAARCEFARTVEDVLARRHRGLLLNARAALAAAPRVALTLATELGHPPVWIEKQLKEFAKIAEPYRVTRREGDPVPPGPLPAQPAQDLLPDTAPDSTVHAPAGTELEPSMLRAN
jgi:glycerol-3-phosphate dehydrogenase